CGDATLVAIADRLVSAAGPSDFIARSGDDRFVLVLEQTTHHQDQMTSRLAALLGRPIEFAGGLALYVSVTVGVARSTSTSSPDPALLLEEAEAAILAQRE